MNNAIIPETENPNTKEASTKLEQFFGKDMNIPQQNADNGNADHEEMMMKQLQESPIVINGKKRLLDVKGNVDIIQEFILPGKKTAFGYRAEYKVSGDNKLHSFYTE